MYYTHVLKSVRSKLIIECFIWIILEQNTSNPRTNATQYRIATQHTNRQGSLQSKHIAESLAEQHKPIKRNSQHHRTTQHNTQPRARNTTRNTRHSTGHNTTQCTKRTQRNTSHSTDHNLEHSDTTSTCLNLALHGVASVWIHVDDVWWWGALCCGGFARLMVGMQVRCGLVVTWCGKECCVVCVCVCVCVCVVCVIW